MDSVDHALHQALQRMQLLAPGEAAEFTALSGGVSSDIVRVRIGARDYCVKRALSKLKVKADWRAPTERNHWEVEWMRTTAAIEPLAVPAVIAEDRAAGVFVMQYLDGARHPQWKQQLHEGHIDPETARLIGERLGHIHAATARRDDLRRTFATDHIFHPIRIEPYLLATARIHTDVAPQLWALAQATAMTKLALVHGDVSPKNILVGPQGPLFLDAECAWYGDPAFDLAFCLNHLLLKCLWHPLWMQRYLDCFAAMRTSYLAQVKWERAEHLERRCARLLPGLFLARIDGKSPVEYIDQDWQRDKVRVTARALLIEPVNDLLEIAQRWRAALTDRE